MSHEPMTDAEPRQPETNSRETRPGLIRESFCIKCHHHWEPHPSEWAGPTYCGDCHRAALASDKVIAELLARAEQAEAMREQFGALIAAIWGDAHSHAITDTVDRAIAQRHADDDMDGVLADLDKYQTKAEQAEATIAALRARHDEEVEYLTDVAERIIETDGCCAHDWLVSVARTIKARYDIAALQAPRQWQPIETAPQDGSWFWVKRDSGNGPRVTAFRWDASHDMWFAGTGWWDSFPMRYTHWMLMHEQPHDGASALPPATPLEST